jgi:hypothetical protein
LKSKKEEKKKEKKKKKKRENETNKRENNFLWFFYSSPTRTRLLGAIFFCFSVKNSSKPTTPRHTAPRTTHTSPSSVVHQKKQKIQNPVAHTRTHAKTQQIKSTHTHKKAHTHASTQFAQNGGGGSGFLRW